MRAVQTCAAAVVLVVTASALPTNGSVTRPPSSIDPDAAHERVRVSPRHQRVAACLVDQAGSGPRCRAVLEEGDSATTVTFTPASRLLSSVSAHGSVKVAFGKARGVQERYVELASGPWTGAWPGAPTLARIDVGTRGKLAIALSTLSGRCELARARCARTDAVSRRITVHRTD